MGLTLPLPLGEGGGEGPGAASPAHLITAAFLTAHDHQLSFDTCFIYRDYLDPATAAPTDTDQLYNYDLGPHADQILEVRDGKNDALIYQNTNGSGANTILYTRPDDGRMVILEKVARQTADGAVIEYRVRQKVDPTGYPTCLNVGDVFYRITFVYRPQLIRKDEVFDCAAGGMVELDDRSQYPFSDEIDVCGCPCGCSFSRLFDDPETVCREAGGCAQTAEGETLNPAAGENTEIDTQGNTTRWNDTSIWDDEEAWEEAMMASRVARWRAAKQYARENDLTPGETFQIGASTYRYHGTRTMTTIAVPYGGEFTPEEREEVERRQAAALAAGGNRRHNGAVAALQQQVPAALLANRFRSGHL